MLRNNPHHSDKADNTGKWRRFSWQIPLPWMLTVPFILQVVILVGLVGYLSYLNGQEAVKDLTNQLMVDMGKRVEEKLTSYFASPPFANQLNADAIARGDLTLDLDRFNREREKYLWQQMQLFPHLTWITLGNERGESLGVWRPAINRDLQIFVSNQSTQYYGNYYATDGSGKLTTRLKVEKPAYDPRVRPWYRETVAAKKPIWTSIYPGFTPGTVFISATHPLYDGAGKLMGVSGIDISLLEIQRFLADNPVTSSGQVFIMERSGLLVASSSEEAPFRVTENLPPQRVNVIQSQTPLIRATANYLRQEVENLDKIKTRQAFQFTIKRQQQFVQVLPFSQEKGLDWLIAIAVPESDVMTKIHTGTQTTVIACLIALAITILAVVSLSRRLVKPIIILSQASQEIAQGDFGRQVRVPRIWELGILANSFNLMSREIQQSHKLLAEYSRSLEQKVSDRTIALEAEIQRRAAVEAALQTANEDLKRLAFLDGLTQIPNRRLFDERSQRQWLVLQREKLPLSLILCDVDAFKQYNDTYGHQEGDRCLCDIAKAIADAARRPADLPARYGGEEFVVLLPNTDLTGAMVVAKVIQTKVRQLKIPHQTSPVSSHVTLSLGVASTIPTPSETLTDLLVRVDNALYRAKQTGRDRIVYD